MVLHVSSVCNGDLMNSVSDPLSSGRSHLSRGGVLTPPQVKAQQTSGWMLLLRKPQEVSGALLPGSLCPDAPADSRTTSGNFAPVSVELIKAEEQTHANKSWRSVTQLCTKPGVS